MMRRRHSIILILLFFIQHLTAQPAVMSELGRMPGAALRMGFGARGIGFGNAMSAVIADEPHAYYNPALVVFQTSRTASASFGILSLDRRLNFLSYGQTLPPTAGIFVGVINSGVGNIDGRDLNGLHTQTYSTSENSALLAFGLQPSERFSVGLASKLLYYRLFEGVNSTTVGFDFGALVKITDQLSLAAVLQDFHSKYSWDTAPLYGRQGNTTVERFPLRKKLGLSYRDEYRHLLFGSEVELIASTVLFRFGAEYSPIPQLTLRAGIDQIDAERNLVAKPSFGFSLNPDFDFVSSYIHYAYVIEPYTPLNMHIIAISVRL
jgi:hypothetical protein